MNCSNCGAVIEPGQEKCFKCGSFIPQNTSQQGYSTQVNQNTQQVYSAPENQNTTPAPRKSWVVTLLLNVFLGYMGIHRFYSGSIGIGVVQLITGGMCGVWWFIDFIMILTNSYRDGNGNPLAK